MMRRQQALFILAELLLPLLGYFYYDWGIIKIALFYQLDLLFRLLQHLMKEYVAAQKTGRKANWLQVVTIVFIYALPIVTISFAIWPFSSQGFIETYWSFIKDEWIFILFFPLMMYMNVQFHYVMPRKYMDFSLKRYISHRWWANIILTGLIIVLFFIYKKYVDDLEALLAIVLTKLVNDLYLMKTDRYELG